MAKLSMNQIDSSKIISNIGFRRPSINEKILTLNISGEQRMYTLFFTMTLSDLLDMWGIVDRVSKINGGSFNSKNIGLIIVKGKSIFDPPSQIHVISIDGKEPDDLEGISGLSSIDFIAQDFREKISPGDNKKGKSIIYDNIYGNSTLKQINHLGGSDGYHQKKNDDLRKYLAKLEVTIKNVTDRTGIIEALK